MDFNMQGFDPQKFLDATLDAPSVRRPPLPTENPDDPNGMYTGVIGEVKVRTWESNKDGQTRKGIAFDVPILITVPGKLQDTLKLQAQVQLTDSIMPDLTAEGMIDNSPGRSRKLRIYR